MPEDTESEKLLADLTSLDKNVRMAAVMAIGESADATMLPALLDRLGAEPDFFVRDNVIWAIVRMGDAAVEPTIALLDDANAQVRFHAAHALSKLGDERAVDALLRALADTDASVVQKATYALGSIGDVRALPALVERVGTLRDEARNTLHDALTALGEPAVEALLPVFSDGTTGVRVAVVEVLGAIGGGAATRALASAMRDREWEVRFAALNALGAIHDAGAKRIIAVALEDPHPHVRYLASRLHKA